MLGALGTSANSHIIGIKWQRAVVRTTDYFHFVRRQSGQKNKKSLKKIVKMAVRIK